MRQTSIKMLGRMKVSSLTSDVSEYKAIKNFKNILTYTGEVTLVLL